jgi:hypothetical protein
MYRVNKLRVMPADSSRETLERVAILILGMHRTGTSALSGFIHLLGADAPGRIDSADHFNPKGYWESAAIREFNDRVLERTGSDWKDWGKSAAIISNEEEIELADIIAKEYGGSRLFVIKDPRLCRIAPFILAALKRLSIEPRIVIPVRNPLESALSLFERDQMQIEEGLLLWLRHMLDAEKVSRDYRRCFVSFDHLLTDWRDVAQRIANALSVRWPVRSVDSDRRIDEFLTRELRHHHVHDQALETRTEAHEWVSAVHEVLRKFSAGAEETTAALGRLDEIRAEFDQVTRLIRPVVRAASQQITELENRIAVLNAEVARRIAEANADRSDLDATRVALARSEKELSAHSRLLDEMRQQSARELILARIEIQREFRKRYLRSEAKRRSLGARLAKKLHLPRSTVSTSREREFRRAELIRSSGLFDPDWYLRQYPGVEKAGIDPAIHYLRHGGNEGRDPSTHFSSEIYRQRYLDVAEAGINPLVHFLEFGIYEGRRFEPSSSIPMSDSSDVPGVLEPDIPVIADGRLTAEHLQFSRRGDRYEEFDPTILNGTAPDVKLVAFYLPQFHAIPENDKFWGKGFTEWRQISRGLPRFPGHYQPRIPSDLGFYDLTSTSVLRQQVEMAKAAGIHGFGFYYYRFDGLRVLEKPLEGLLASPDIDMPFMLVWANENWTRTWDGMSGQMLLRQSYAREDETELLADLVRHFSDRRYIRIGDRPLFVIYQPRHVPDARATFARWRERWRDEFGLEPLFFMAQTFGSEDPTAFGLDGAMEFPPHKLTSNLPGRPVPDAYSPAFTGRVVSYDDVVAASLNEVSPAFPLIKTIIPSWDNDARRPMRGTTIEGSTPGKYQNWLFELARRARANPVMGESIVAVNAWNEWAEGAYLEPDVYYGSAYLNATAQALLQFRQS